MNNFPLVKIDWVDASQKSGWHNKEDIDFERPMDIMTVGYIIHQNDEKVTVAASLTDLDCDNYQCNGIMMIPQVTIKKISHLTEASMTLGENVKTAIIGL